MKITQTFKRQSCQAFFFTSELGICLPFVKNFISNVGEVFSIVVTLATKNPKKKGFKVVERVEHDIWVNGGVLIAGNEYCLCGTEGKALNEYGVKNGDTFWVKIV